MLINIGGGLLVNAQALEAIWYNEEQGITLLYPRGMVTAFLSEGAPPAFSILGDVTHLIAAAMAENQPILDLSRRDAPRT